MNTSSSVAGLRAAWLLAVVEFFFALSWVVYVIFLPELLARAGVARHYLPWVLLVDQLVFALADWWVGVAVDRARAELRRLAPLLVLLSTLSAAAMLALPWVATMPSLFVLTTLFWVATSSALRAPPYVLLSRYAARATLPRLAGIQLLGLAAASALAPYLGSALKGVDPAWPFLLSALAVGSTALALAFVERTQPVGAGAPVVATAAATTAARQDAPSALLLVLAFLLASGQQVHTAINSAPQFIRVADAALLPWLLPVFWIGFSFGLLLAGRLVRTWGTLPTLQVACTTGALALTGIAVAASLPLQVAAQMLAGLAWAVILCASIGLAAERGEPLRSGRHTGALMATLAVAAMSRLGLAVSGAGAHLGPLLEWMPVVLWGVTAALLLRLRPR